MSSVRSDVELSPCNLASATPLTAGVAQADWLRAGGYTFESRFLDLWQSRVHYVDEGSGPPLLLLHAAPAWSFIYRHFIHGLRDRFRCIALDFPGFGLSPAPTGFGYTLAELSAVVEQFIIALDLRDIRLLVHDASGSIGLGAAGRSPERFHSLIITDTFAWPLKKEPLVRGMLRFVSGPVFGFFNQRFNVLPRLVSAVAPMGRKLSPAERAGYTQSFDTPAKRQRILRVFRSLIESEAYLRETELGLQRLAHLPVLLMYGQFDPLRLLGWQQRFERIFPNHYSLAIKGEGHFPHEGAPKPMIEHIRAWQDESDGCDCADTAQSIVFALKARRKLAGGGA